MAKAARSRGCEFYERTLVTGFAFDKKRLTAVKTDKGDITCEHLVTATGNFVR